MKMPKIMEIQREKIQVGDVVVDGNENTMYLVTEIGRTFLHGHRYFKCCYTEKYSPDITKWCLQDLSPEKTIIRLVEEKKAHKKT